MVAVGNAHGDVVYPRPEWEPQSLDSLVEENREFRSDWDEARVLQEAGFMREWEVRRAEFERGVIERVRAAGNIDGRNQALHRTAGAYRDSGACSLSSPRGR